MNDLSHALLSDKSTVVVAGHIGSGKTEFAVNYAMSLSKAGIKTALIDLDIANPYFRSRERRALLAQNGIALYSNSFDADIAADLPAVSVGINAPLEDPSIRTIIDTGGDDFGIRVLNQFTDMLWKQQCDILCVMNRYRPETSTLEGAVSHMEALQQESKLRITGLVNNTNLLRETQIEDLLYGDELLQSIGRQFGISIRYTSVIEEHVVALQTLWNSDATHGTIFPIRLYMREPWLDQQL